MAIKVLLLLSLVLLGIALSPEPVPTCSTPHITLKDFPISLNEIQTFNPNEIFKGYNLKYQMIGGPEFVYLREKFKLFKQQNTSQVGLKSYHLDHQDNQWGGKLVTLSEQGSSTIVRWGRTDAIDAIPLLDEQVTVQSDPNTTCYDAIWLRQKQLIMVDCITKGSLFSRQNVFLYVNVTSQQKIDKQVKNDMYVPYNVITHRRMVHLQEDGEDYIMRAYFANAVDQHYADNTYMEVMLIKDPMRPWTIKVMDRSFLLQDKLAIMDFKLYLGDMYILDYHSGMISFDLTPNQDIIIKSRYRTSSGFHKMGIYTNNLDNQVLLALANTHGIYEVDLTNPIRPAIVAKYSIMEGSQVSSLWVNQEYLVAQIKANVTNGTSQIQEYHSTFIFDRGTRTYTNAYAVVPHKSYKVIADLNLKHNLLLTIDEEGLSTYQIDEPMVTIYPTNTADMNKNFAFTIRAVSSNQYNGHNLVCSFDFSFIVVDVNSMAIWTTGQSFPDTYYANYPGQMVIPLNRYIIGANMTYGVQEKVKNQSVELPSHWVYQQNDTLIHWDREPSMFKYTFLRKEQYEWMGKEYFFIYAQDAVNSTHFTRCKANAFSKDVFCSQDSHMPHINQKIDNLTATAFLPNYGQVLHLAAVLYEEFPNEVFIYDVQRKDMFSRPIIFDRDWQGRIQSIEFLGHYLVVVLRHIKTLVFFDMKACHDHQDKQCQEVYRIDSITMDQLGVKYFSPLDVYTSDFHPFVLFVQNVDSVIILDITRKGPLLLDVIESPGSRQPGFWKWKMAITHGHLVIINPPNIIEEFSLNELYTRKTTHMTKSFPVYNYTIPDKFDCDFSDKGDLLYITAEDTQLPDGQNSVVLVYRSGVPAVSAFYDVFHINGKYEDMLLDATGNFEDYVTVAMGSILMMFRQYQQPLLVFNDTFSDFEFNITYTNDPQQRYHYLFNSKVNVANYPQGITINDSQLNQSDFLSSQVKYQNKYQEFVLDDSTWFNGSVLNYTVEGCQECGSKVRVVNHLEEKRDFFAEIAMDDYVYSHDGGFIQQFQSVIKMQHNGSVDQVVTFPSVLDGEACSHITHSWIYDYTLSACKHGDEVYLYTTTYTSFKPFVNGPHYSGAKSVSGLHVMEDIMVLVDVDENPSKMSREGGILIYAMNHDPFDPEIFHELEFIDTMDLESAVNWPGGPAYIGNADIVFTNQTDIYRLILTELRHGVFFVDFKWSRGRLDLQIVKVQFVDMNKILIQDNLHMPNLAYFEGIRVTEQEYNAGFKYWELKTVLTTRNFHIFEVSFHVDQSGTVLYSNITKIFYRYGYYETQNYIKHFDGYFAVVQKLPILYQVYPWYSRQVLTVYDTKERWIFNSTEPAPTHFHQGTDVPAAWMLGGMPFPEGRVGFDFNFTFTRNRTDPFRNIGLLVLHSRQATIRQVLLHDHISIVLQDGIGSNQDAKFKANNDFSSVDINLSIVAGGLGGGAIVAIVIGCILVAVGGGYLVYKWNLKRKDKISRQGLEDSLIDRDTLNVAQGQEDDDDQEDQEDQSSEEQQDQEQEDQEQEGEEEKPTQQEKPQQENTGQGENQKKQPQEQPTENNANQQEGNNQQEGENQDNQDNQ